MKITPILTSILMNAFALVGIFSVALIILMNVFLDKDPEPKLSCINDREFDFVASHAVNGEKFELIRYKSGSSNNVNVFVLYNRKDRKHGCVEDGKQLAMKVLDTREANTQEKKFPEKIVVLKDAIKFMFTDTPKVDVSATPVVWDIKSKLASVQ